MGRFSSPGIATDKPMMEGTTRGVPADKGRDAHAEQFSIEEHWNIGGVKNRCPLCRRCHAVPLPFLVD